MDAQTPVPVKTAPPAPINGGQLLLALLRDVLTPTAAARAALYGVAALVVLFSAKLGEAAAAATLLLVAGALLALRPPLLQPEHADGAPQQTRKETAAVAAAAAAAFVTYEQVAVWRGVWQYTDMAMALPLDEFAPDVVNALLPYLGKRRVPLWLAPAWAVAAVAVLDLARVAETVRRVAAAVALMDFGRMTAVIRRVAALISA